MTAKSPEILFVGAFTRDTIYHVTGFGDGPGKFLAGRSTSNAAGMATSAATAASRLGASASLWASVGDDPQGDAMIAEIIAEGVNCSPVRKIGGGRSASATIIIDESGERWIVVDYDPLTQSAPGSLPSGGIERFDAVMCDIRWPGAARLALKAAREAGKIALLDADVGEQALLIELSGLGTHVAASAPGAAITLGHTAHPSVLVAGLADLTGGFACVTDGGHGTWWTDGAGGKIKHVPSAKVDVVDTLAAGDVFHGALTLALAEGQGHENAIRFASAAAALKCTVFGGRIGAPNRADTLALMHQTYA